MKKEIILFLLSVCSYHVFAKAQNNDTYCRPVKSDFNGETVKTKPDKDGDKSYDIKIFEGEWFVTQASNNANAHVLTESGDRWLKTDGDSSAKTMLDAAKRTPLDQVRKLEIDCAKTNDSIYIKIKVERVKNDTASWFYVIDQTRNVLLKKCDSTYFNRWIAFPLTDSTRIIRVSPESHVVSFFKVEEINNALFKEIKDSTSSKPDTLVYKVLLCDKDTISQLKEIRKGGLNPDPFPEIGLGVIIGVILLAVIVGGIVFWYFWYYRRNRRTHEAFDPELHRKELVYTIVNEPKSEEQRNDYESCNELPYPPILGKKYKVQLRVKEKANGQKPGTVKAKYEMKYFEVKEIFISKNWKDITEEKRQGEERIRCTINDLSTLPVQPQNGDIVQVELLPQKLFGNRTRLLKYVVSEIPDSPKTQDVQEGTKDVPITSVEKNYTLEECLDSLPKELADLKQKISHIYRRDLQIQKDEIEEKNNQSIEKLLSDQADDIDRIRREKDHELERERESREDIQRKYDNLKNNFDEEIKKAEDKIQHEATKRIEKAERERDVAIKDKNEISDKLYAQFEKEKNVLEQAKQKADEKFQKADEDLQKTLSILKDTTKEKDEFSQTIKRLEEAQKKFDQLAFVPFAVGYLKKVLALLNVVERVNRSAANLLDIESVGDPYHIMKCLAKYSKSISEIDLIQFYADIKMVTEGQIVLKGTTLATYNQNLDQNQLDNSLKIYFFDTYLSTFVDAAIVLNESCIGLDRLVEGLNQADVIDFINYREELKQCINLLDIEVETTHLFDKVGQKIDLRVTPIDAGFSTGDILEIENCYVYLKGSQRPDTKIRVKAQS